MTINDNIATIISLDAADIDDTFDQLLGGVIDAYHACRALELQNPSPFSERERRKLALCDIRETLEGHPLEAFQAETLEFIGMLLDYWRVAEREVGGAPEPDALQ